MIEQIWKTWEAIQITKERWLNPCSIDGEIWRSVERYDGRYNVSNYGRVMSLCRHNLIGRRVKTRILIPQVNLFGYIHVVLSNDAITHTLVVHRLVMEAFFPIRDLDKVQINHKNGIKSDNRLENLEWCTRSQNQKHAVINGLKITNPENHSKLKACEVLEIRRLYATGKFKQSMLGAMFKLCQQQISSLIRKEYWKHI